MILTKCPYYSEPPAVLSVPRRQQMQKTPAHTMEGRPESRGVTLIFTGGHISLEVAFKELTVILGLYTCNYSLTVKQELSTATR